MIDLCATEFRQDFDWLYREIVSGIPSDTGRAVVFTASHFDEGVTTIVLSFGMFLAGLVGPENVVLVEGNIRRPSFRSLWDIQVEAGLESVIAGQADLADTVCPTGENEAYVLATDGSHAGSQVMPLDPKQAADRPSLGAVVERLKKEFLYVLVDSAPVIPFSDACTLAPVAGGFIFVVEAERTPSEVVNRALEKLSTSGAEILGIILNKRQFHIPRFLYRLL